MRLAESAQVGSHNLHKSTTSTMTDAESLSHLRDLSATCVGSFQQRVEVYKGARKGVAIAELYATSGAYLKAEAAYAALFPGCEDAVEMGCFVAAREKILYERAIDAIERQGVKNVVILACGVTPLPVYLRQRLNDKLISGVKVISTDLPGPLEIQRSLCRRLLDDHAHNEVELQSLDVLDSVDWANLKVQLVPGGIALLCEGLLGYFDYASVQRCVGHAMNLLKDNGGFFLTDIATKNGLRNTPFKGGSAKLLRKFYEVAGVNPDSLAFEKGDECASFLTSNGIAFERVGLEPGQIYMPDAVTGEDRVTLAKILSKPLCFEMRRAG